MLNILNKGISSFSKAMWIVISWALTFFLTGMSTALAQAPATVAKVEDTGGPVMGLLGDIVYPLALGIGTLFVSIGGFALDLTIHHLIIGMGGIWNSEFGIGMTKAWTVIRDIFNILFIFSFVFIGIKTILNSDDSSTKRGLVHLVIAAIFINFSLLISQVIIDFSNVAASQIYNMAVAGIESPEVGKAVTGSPSLTLAFLDVVKLGSFFDAKPEGIKGVQLVTYSLLMMIFFIISGIIFLFATYHIIYRFVALMIYMVLSPILFLGFILPNFKSYTDRWLGGLLRQSFFAPAFLFLMYLSLLALSSLKEFFGVQGGQNGFPSIMEGADMSTTAFTIFVFFAIGIGFLYAAVKVGDQMGISGSKSALGAIGKVRSMGQKMIGGAAGMPFGLAAGLLRGTVGEGFHKWSESDKLKDAASRRGPAGVLARMQLRGARVVGDASFDARRVGGVGKSLGIGEGRKGGFKSQTEEIEKKEKEFAKSLGEVDDDDVRVNRFIVERGSLEDQLRKQKLAKEKAVGDLAKGAIAEEIAKTEKELKQIEEKIKTEKSRRQVGIDVDPARAKSTKEAYAKTKAKLDDLNVGLAKARKKRDEATTEAEREAAEAAMAEAAVKIKEVNKEQKELAKQAKEAEGTLGYAGVLDKRTWYTSPIFGRTAYQDHEAGDAIRKQYSKAAKKTKQDQDVDGIKETLEKATKKD